MKKSLALILGALLLTGCTEEDSTMNLDKKDVEEVEEAKKEEPVTEPVTVVEPVEEVKEPIPLTTEETQYLEVIVETLTTFDENTSSITSLNEELELNPTLINDLTWQNGITENYMIITMLTGLIKQMEETNNVPERFEELHYYWYETFSFMKQAGDKMSEVIDDGYDEELVSMSQSYIASSNSMSENLQDELDSLMVEIKGE